jgi:hypothetical protein
VIRENFMHVSTSACAALLAFLSLATPAHERETRQAVTLPMQLELDRPYIDVTLVGPDGKTVRAHAWVDTGGGAVMLSAGLARRLGLKRTGKPTHEEGHALASVPMPLLQMGGQLITLSKVSAVVVLDAPETLSNTDADMALPGRALRDHVVTFDYPAGTFTVAGRSHPDAAGVPVKGYIGASGMPVVWLSVAGSTEGFLLDTGGQYSMISAAKLHAWGEHDPAWKRASGAYGPANMLLSVDNRLAMLRIGEMQWGRFVIRDAGAVSRSVGTYEEWMSHMLGRSVIGSIGGNVLRDFRVTIDYPAGKIRLQRGAVPAHRVLALVGVTLVNAPHGGYAIAGTASGEHDVHCGDQLIAVDGHQVSGVAYSRVASWLSGEPGETRTLDLVRGGKAVRIKASVRPVF